MQQQLTDRQRQCLSLASMMSDKEIARELGISPHTVSLHIRTAMKKLGVSNRRAALRLLADNPLYAAPDMARPVEEVPVGPVNGSPPLGDLRQDDDTRLKTDWRLGPAALPPVPRSAFMRLGLVLAFSMAFLVAGAVLLGLMGIVVDVANDWAVDPHRS